MKKLILILLCSLVAACSSPPAKFYVLTYKKQLNTSASKAKNIYLGLGPIRIPRYLQKPQIITQLSYNEINLNEFHRWGEPLQANIKSVIENNLSRMIPTHNIINYPWLGDQRINYRLHVRILKFDTDSQLISHLVVNWRITNKANTRTYLVHTTHFQQQIHPGKNQLVTYPMVVSAMNANLNDFCEKVASAIRRLAR